MSQAVEEAVLAIEARLSGATRRGDEALVLASLEGLDDDGLDAALRRLDLRRLWEAMDDRLLGPDHRTALERLLTVERLGALGVRARAALVAALQRGRTGGRDERAIRAVFLGTRGAELTALKNAIDHGEDHRDLQQLVFSDIDDATIRDEILAHFAAAAEPVDEVKLLSDIDDTFYANWKDERFPAKTVYPGVLQLYAEIDRGPSEQGRMGDIAFVTARPKDRPGLVEKLTHATLRERGLEVATVLAGSFANLLTHASIADKKLRNFRDYAALFPEYGFVFIGDSGQGDASFGERMRAEEPERVRAILIHDVVATPDDERASWAKRGVSFFDSYVGAALLAFEAGLISEEGLGRVVESAGEELDGIAFEDPEDERLRADELAVDSERARRRLG